MFRATNSPILRSTFWLYIQLLVQCTDIAALYVHCISCSTLYCSKLFCSPLRVRNFSNVRRLIKCNYTVDVTSWYGVIPEDWWIRRQLLSYPPRRSQRTKHHIYLPCSQHPRIALQKTFDGQVTRNLLISLPRLEVKVKVKWSRYRPGVAQMVGRGIALPFHDRGTRRGWVVSSTPRPHFTPGKDPVPIWQEAGWAPGPVWTVGKSRPHRDSIPDRPTRSHSLSRLSYPVHSAFGGNEWNSRPDPSSKKYLSTNAVIYVN